MACEVSSTFLDWSCSMVISREAEILLSLVKQTGVPLKYCQQAPEWDHCTFLLFQVLVKLEPFKFFIKKIFR
jgi:hypothetical protein